MCPPRDDSPVPVGPRPGPNEDPNGDPRAGVGGTAIRRIVPLFPLPDLVLFPGQVQPLHIFEPRYRQMVRDLLDGSGELVLGTVLGADKGRLAEVAPVQEIAGLGRLEQYRALPDGRFLVILLGLRRVRVTPIAGDHLYPICEIDPLPLEQEVIVDPIARARYEGKLRTALEGHWKDDDPLPEGLPLFQLADLLQMHLQLSPEQRYQIFSTRPLEERIREVLAAAKE
jgi:Lon protease-like protein